MSLSDRERAIRLELKHNFIHYADKCLKIKSKKGSIEPLTLNKAQLYLHDRLQAQLENKNKIRAIILKGRQQGCSTYVGARFYHKTTHYKGLKVFILTHSQDATDNLFGMANRYHEHCPELVKAHTSTANAKELVFDLLDSGYKVGTAGMKAVGRSQTIQLFHGSEVAFWSNADEHAAGVLQAIPDMDNTEIILESTANGMGNYFHKTWQEAEAGINEYDAIFIPWYWQDEYKKPINDNFVLTEEEELYKASYKLTNEQMAWRRSKIIELKDELLFRQEYPATASEAFQLTGHDSFISANSVLQARKNTCEGFGALVIGVDPARYGDDRFSVAFRQGRKVIKVESRNKIDVVSGANWIKTIIDSHNPARAFVDVGGLGAGVYDILKSWGKPYDSIIKAINFGGSPQDESSIYKNRRAEMWGRSKEWLEDVGGADIPDLDSLQTDACAPSYKYDMSNKLQIQSKEEMRSKNIRSPDEWDAIALTFAEPVKIVEPLFKPRIKTIEIGNGHNKNLSWMGV